MYLISAYFDEKTNHMLQHYIDGIAEMTDNYFMTENQVPPHITISAFEVREEENVKCFLTDVFQRFSTGEIFIASVGALFPYVLYATPVLNDYLQNLSEQIYSAIWGLSGIKISEYYRPMQWLPHITLGKKLDRVQMQKGFAFMQEQFVPIKGEIVSLGFAKTNSYRDIMKKKVR